MNFETFPLKRATCFLLPLAMFVVFRGSDHNNFFQSIHLCLIRHYVETHRDTKTLTHTVYSAVYKWIKLREQRQNWWFHSANCASKKRTHWRRVLVAQMIQLTTVYGNVKAQKKEVLAGTGAFLGSRCQKYSSEIFGPYWHDSITSCCTLSCWK